MSSAARDYLEACLGLDPRREAGSMLALRREHRGMAAPVEDRARPDAAELQAEVNEIAHSFFSHPPDELRARLAALDLEAYPDLARHVRRMRAAAEVFEVFVEAFEDREMDGTPLREYARARVLPRREAIEMQRRLVRNLGARGASATKGFTKRLRAHYPEIVALDPEAFQEVVKAKKLSRDRQPLRVGGSFLLIWFSIRVIRWIWEELFRD